MTIPANAMTKDHDLYADELLTELIQCTDEGLETESVEPLFRAAAALPRGELKSGIADALYLWTQTAPTNAEYPFNEPSTLPQIRALSRPFKLYKSRIPTDAELEKKIRGEEDERRRELFEDMAAGEDIKKREAGKCKAAAFRAYKTEL